MNWKDPDIAARLAELWRAGHSCSTIARMIGGVTRNSVIGAVSRAGLPKRPIQTGSPYSRINRKKKNQWNGKPKPSSKGKPFVFGNKPAVAMSPLQSLHRDGLPIPPPAETDIPRVSFEKLEDKHCRWICKDDPAGHPQHEPLYCGADKVAGTSWCMNHLRRAFQPPQTRPRPRPPEVSAPVPVPEKELEAA